MQVVGMKGPGSLGYQYKGAWDAIFTVARTEGVRGMYRGLWPNLRESFYTCGGIIWRYLNSLAHYLVKVAPSIATSFFTYELVKDGLLGL